MEKKELYIWAVILIKGKKNEIEIQITVYSQVNCIFLTKI